MLLQLLAIKLRHLVVNMLRKILRQLFAKPLPVPTEAEKQHMINIKSTVKTIPIVDIKNTTLSESEKEWAQFVNRLRELILTDDPRNFLHWDVVRKTMFISNSSYIEIELNYLKSLPNWNTCWRGAIKEYFVGHPLPCVFDSTSSGNSIHHAYHIAKFEEITNVKISDMNFIFEFGGGYGNMCKLCYQRGFRGKYIIFDLPQFSALQNYYLQMLNLPVKPIDKFIDEETGFFCISDYKQLTNAINIHGEAEDAMFIATWSLSETPLHIRESILPLAENFNYLLVSYQHQFGEINNIDYFTKQQNLINQKKWHDWQIPHLPGNSYLIGSPLTDEIS